MAERPTREMIKAGMEAYAGFNPEFDCLEDVIAEIWTAMNATRNRGVSLPSGASDGSDGLSPSRNAPKDA